MSCNMKVEEFGHKSETTIRGKVIFLSAFLGWLLYCILFFRKIRNGFFIVYNACMGLWGAYTGTICSFYDTNQDTGWLWCAIAYGGMLVLLLYCLVKRSRKSWRYLWTKAVAVTVTGVLGFGLLFILGADHGFLKNSFQEIRNEVDDIRYGTNEKAGLYDGNLRKAAGREKGKNNRQNTVLEVVMSNPESMYFRGFVGEYYEDGQWLLMDNQTKYEDWELFYWLHKSGFYGQTRLGQLAAESGQIKENKISVKNLAADRRYIYTPYELAASDLLDAEKIGDSGIEAKGFRGQDSFSFTAYQGARIHYPDFLESENTHRETDNPVEMHYRQWVYEHYLTVPEEFSRQFQSVLEKDAVTKGKVQVFEARQLILEYLTNHFQYDENPQSSVSEDPLLYFLQKSGKGYDIHYASTATLMFRYLGIPARYVEGFLVTEQMAENAGKSMVISLDESTGHAWTEIYMDGVGWVPFEATPAYRDMVKEPEEINVSSMEDTAGTKQNMEDGQSEEKEDILSGQKEQLPAGARKQNKDREEEKKTPASVWNYILLGAFIFVIVAIIIIVLKIRKKKKLLLESFSISKRSLACQNIFAYIMQLLTKSGLQWRSGGLEENIEEVEGLFSKEYAADFVRYWNMHEKIRFGREEPREEQYEQIREFLFVTENMLKKKRAGK